MALAGLAAQPFRWIREAGCFLSPGSSYSNPRETAPDAG
jgi:hypothetical protein